MPALSAGRGIVARVAEQPLPPKDEWLSIREAVEVFEQLGSPGKTPKAIQGLFDRGSLAFAREWADEAKKTGRARRVVTTEAWIREYLEGSRGAMRRRAEPSRGVTYAQPLKAESSSKSYWQEIAEQQAVEILRLRAQIAELENRRSPP